MQGRIMDRLKTFFRTSQRGLRLHHLRHRRHGSRRSSTRSRPATRCSSISIGEFGDRFGEIAAAYGADVTRLQLRPRHRSRRRRHRRGAVAKDPEFKAVLVTHNETSTGVTNDIQAIVKAMPRRQPRRPDDRRRRQLARLHPLRGRRLGRRRQHDGLAEGLHDPAGPGLRQLQRPRLEGLRDARRCRSTTSTSASAASWRKKGQTPFTPAVSLYYGLDLALRDDGRRGPGAVQRAPSRRRRVHAAEGQGAGPVAAGRRTAGFRHRDQRPSSPRASTPPGCSPILNNEYETVLAAGQGKLAGKIVRIGHMGLVSKGDIDLAVLALESALGQPRLQEAGGGRLGA